MTVSFARPDVADMTLRVLSRSVHPELLETVRELRFSIGKHSAILRLCRDGHAIEFRSKDAAITELAVSRMTPTPASGCACQPTPDRLQNSYGPVRSHSLRMQLPAGNHRSGNLPAGTSRNGNRCPQSVTGNCPARQLGRQPIVPVLPVQRSAAKRPGRALLPHFPRQRCNSQDPKPV